MSSGGGETSTETGTTSEDETSDNPDGTAGPVADGSGGSGSSGSNATNETADGTTTTGPIDPGSTTDPMGSTSTPAEESVDDGGELQSCDEIFDQASGYELCISEDAACTFNVFTDAVSSCDDVCDSFGETCIEAHDNGGVGDDLCLGKGMLPCDYNMKDSIICVCTRTTTD